MRSHKESASRTNTASSELAQGPKRERTASKARLSLFPLSIETALGAALQTGVAPESKRKKPVDKRR
jgi:hypothetical protein